jgi:hypothetical protein
LYQVKKKDNRAVEATTRPIVAEKKNLVKKLLCSGILQLYSKLSIVRGPRPKAEKP